MVFVPEPLNLNAIYISPSKGVKLTVDFTNSYQETLEVGILVPLRGVQVAVKTFVPS